MDPAKTPSRPRAPARAALSSPLSFLPERGLAHAATVAALVLLYLALLRGGIQTASVTTDEFGHLPAGYAFLTTGQTRWLAMNPPLEPAWAALPLLFDSRVRLSGLAEEKTLDFWDLGEAFLVQNREHYQSLYGEARLMVALMAAAGGLLIYALARLVAGPRAGLIALFFFACSPDFLAHGGLVTADLSAAVAGLAVIAAGLFYRRRRTALRFGLFALAATLLFLSKFSALMFLPLLPLILIAPAPGVSMPADEARERRAWARPVIEFIGLGLVAWLIASAAYGFQGSFAPLRSFIFTSDFLQRAKELWPGLPSPFPAAFLSAFDRQLAEHQSPWPSYFLGRLTYQRSAWYYLVGLALKTPLPFLIALVVSLCRLRRRDLAKALWSLGPGLWFYVLISASPAKQIGTRMALPGMGFLLVFAGVMIGGEGGGPVRGKRGRGFLVLVAALTLWSLGDALAASPDYLSFFNEAAGGPGLPNRGEKYLADSNLDWGQDWMRLGEWQREHRVAQLWLAGSGLTDPALYGVHYRLSNCRPEPGFHAVSVNLVLGIEEFTGRRDCYATFHRLAPVDRVGASIWIYHFP